VIADALVSAGGRVSRPGYQVNFRLPPYIEKAAATLQASAAWLAGALVTIHVQ
jgi:hypothetical protein